MKTAPLILLPPALVQAGPWLASNSAFIPSQRLQTRLPIDLHAKPAAKKKQKKNKASDKKGGGFGSTSPRQQQPKAKGAGVVYPDLEPQVVQTLVPSPIDGSKEELGGGILSEEMYDRLEDIYGLPQFNFGGEGAIYKSIGVVGGGAADDGGGAKGEDAAAGGSLFDDILSGGASSQSSSTSALDDLLSPTTPLSSPPISLTDVMESNPQSESSATFDLNSIQPFQKFRVLHTDPMVLAIDDFFTTEECDKLVQVSIDSESNTQQPGEENLQPMLLGQSQTVGKDFRSKAQRTSTTWFHYYEGVPELMAKASRLLGLEGIDRFEEPQTVRYRRNEKFTWHLDALSPEEAADASGAGQRVATLLVYLTDLSKEDGGATMFRDLGGDDGPLKV